MESLLSSPSVTIRNSAEAMAELHECLVGMARREAVLRTQLEEASAERAIALSRREAATGAAVTEKAAAAGWLGTGAAQLRAPLGAEQGGLAQAQQGVPHQQRELQSDVQSAVRSAREERERHEAEVAALHAQHRAQVDAMRAELAQAHQAADAALEQALALTLTLALALTLTLALTLALALTLSRRWASCAGARTRSSPRSAPSSPR